MSVFDVAKSLLRSFLNHQQISFVGGERTLSHWCHKTFKLARNASSWCQLHSTVRFQYWALKHRLHYLLTSCPWPGHLPTGTCYWVLAVVADAVVLWKAKKLQKENCWALPLLEPWAFSLILELCEWEALPCKWVCNDEQAFASRVLFCCWGSSHQDPFEDPNPNFWIAFYLPRLHVWICKCLHCFHAHTPTHNI